MTDIQPKRKRGRPEKPIPRIDETPERVAKAIFSAVKPPNPMRRKFNQEKKPVGERK